MEQYCIRSKITPEVFREFALFDTLRRQKRYKGPALFALIMMIFAAICFTQVGQREHAALLGGVLLAVGVLLPAVYILTFIVSVRKKARQVGMAKGPAYTVELSPSGVTAAAGEQRVSYKWEQIFFAYRLKRSICLYVAANRAYILPLGNDGDDGLWSLICGHSSEKKHKDLRR